MSVELENSVSGDASVSSSVPAAAAAAAAKTKKKRSLPGMPGKSKKNKEISNGNPEAIGRILILI